MMTGDGFTLCYNTMAYAPWVLMYCIPTGCLSVHVGVTVFKHHRMAEL